jgi:hypothetical protein
MLLDPLVVTRRSRDLSGYIGDVDEHRAELGRQVAKALTGLPILMLHVER